MTLSSQQHHSLRVEAILNKRRLLTRPLHEAVKNAVPVLVDCGVLKRELDTEHYLQLLQLVCTKVFRPLFTNYALSVTDKNNLAKAFSLKPLSQKDLKLQIDSGPAFAFFLKVKL